MEEKLKERLTNEKNRLADLEVKVKRCKENILNLESQLREKRFSEAEHVFTVTGLTLDEIMAAVAAHDLAPLQRKIVATSRQTNGSQNNDNQNQTAPPEGEGV